MKKLIVGLILITVIPAGAAFDRIVLGELITSVL